MSGRVVVVTGGSGGVGRATATRFAARGDRVAVLARGEAGLKGAVADVEHAGGTAFPVDVDVADAAAVDAAAARVEDELGPIDVWVNNAMATVFSPIAQMTPEQFRRATEVTYLGFVWGTMAALRRMTPRDHGVIVQVGSALSYRAIPLQAAYCGAKFAIRGFTDSLRTELLHDGSNVRVTMVQLPAHNTPQFSWGETNLERHPQPVPPIYQPEVAAEAIVFAADRPRRELWVGFRNVLAVLAAKTMPGALDHLLSTNGYEDQQMDRPLDPDRRSNLFEPADEHDDHGAHGIFGDRSTATSTQLRLAMLRPFPGLLHRPIARVLRRLL